MAFAPASMAPQGLKESSRPTSPDMLSKKTKLKDQTHI
jgi:hypothetical protein